MSALVTIWPNARPIGWTGALTPSGAYIGTPDPATGAPRIARAFEPYPLRVALTAHYSTDAHYVPYVLCFDGTPGLTPRCNMTANDAIVGLGGVLFFGCLTLDCDDPIAHATHTDARPEWRRDWWRRVACLPFPCAAYETRGGGRIVCELHRPVEVAEYFLALSGLHAFAEDVGIVADRLIDAQRCYRLPFVTRDGARQDRRAALTFRPLSADEQRALTRCGEAHPMVVPREVRPPAPKPAEYEPGTRIKPSDFLDREVSWAQILEPAGWRFGGMLGEQEAWYRPGKAATWRGPPSALTNYQGNGRLKVLTTNGGALSGCYDKLGAIAALEGVDIREAARIAAKRFGMPGRMVA